MPIAAFRCCHCLADLYVSEGALSADAGDADRLRLLQLVRGRMLLLSQAKRTTTRAGFATGRRALDSFAHAHKLRVLPLPPFMIMDWAVHDLTGRNLDSSTIKVRFNAVYDIYDYARARLGLRSLANPLRDPEVLLFNKVLGNNYKKRSKARCSVAIRIAHQMLAAGWDLRHAVGLWGRLRWTFLNLGMLRVGGVNQLIVVYDVVETDFGMDVSFAAASDVSVQHDDTLAEDFIDINVDVDKNVGSWNRRHAYIPGTVPALAAAPVAWLKEYLIQVRPPSGGPLFAKPGRKGFSKPKNASADIKRAYKRACTHGAVTFDQPTHDALGTHSGRKSLAQWLWDNGHCRRIIADAGGWFLKRDAVDMYFKTARHIILRAVRTISTATA